MRPFTLFRPSSIEEASTKAGADTVLKAGGIDLLDRLKERVEAPKTVVDLMTLRDDLSLIGVGGGGVTLGALCTLAQLGDAAELSDPAFAAVATAAAEAASPQIRSRATLGGNLLQLARCWYLRNLEFSCAHSGRGDTCLAQEGEHRFHAIMGTQDCIRVHPSNMAPPLLALDATVRVLTVDGRTEREMPLRDLYPQAPTADAPEHTLAQGEILVSVRIPEPTAGTRSAYRESREKQAHDWATTAAAARLLLTDGVIKEAKICLGAVAPNPVIAATAARSLVGKAPSREVFAAAAEIAYENADPLDQNAYKVPVGKAVLIDALQAAAGGK